VSWVGFVTWPYLAQHCDALGSPDRADWIGGHGTEPYEQNTQQSPGLGRNVVSQPVHV